MSGKSAKRARREAKKYSEVFETQFAQRVAEAPRAGTWTKIVWFFFPHKRAKVLETWRLEREKTRAAYMARSSKKLAHIAADLKRKGIIE